MISKMADSLFSIHWLPSSTVTVTSVLEGQCAPKSFAWNTAFACPPSGNAIVSADRVLKNTDATLFGKDSPAPQDLRDTLQEVTRAARSVRILVDYLERHPEMLIRGKTEEKP